MKKKLWFCWFMAFLLCSTAKGSDLTNEIIWYLPNRCCDITDIITINIGVGPAVKGELLLSRTLDFGAGIGSTAKLIKGYNRQYGGGVEDACFLIAVAGAKKNILSR